MKISTIKVQNFRTLENVELNFPEFYSAICGKNDSGKTNVVRIIRRLLGGQERFLIFREEESITLKDDFTQWKDTKSEQRQICIAVTIEINEEQDTGLYQFVVDYLKLAPPYEQDISICLYRLFASDESKGKIQVIVQNQTFEGLKAEEVFKKVQSSNVVLFHNSTEPKLPYLYGTRYLGSVMELSEEYRQQIQNMKKSINRGLKRIAKSQQQQIEELLGRLESKYKVALSVPSYDFDDLPYSITLGDSKIGIVLNEWGSGTQNRTLILLTLFRARQISGSGTSASKITPIIVIEEPESFLHPSAQAQFGRVIQDLAAEFRVQVIVTSHSPYMLSKSNPSSNILLGRRVEQGQLRETIKVDTSGDNWMEPFGLALGLNRNEFQPWEKLFLSGSECVILVEGDIDKEYFDLLRDPAHGANQLVFRGEILPYSGRDNLKNAVLLSFIRNRYEKIFITYDLDADDDLSETFNRLGFERNEHYCAIGKNTPGKKNIEGLVPEKITQVVYAANPNLVDQAMNGTAQEKRSAKQNLKHLIFEEFKSTAKSGSDFYSGFYELVKVINKAFAQ